MASQDDDPQLGAPSSAMLANLGKLKTLYSPGKLVHGAAIGVQVLRDVEETLNKYETFGETDAICDSIWSLKNEAAMPKAIIAVTGHTGAGKSSVINAVLDEPNLVPTSCWKACTAAVIEIGYNEVEDPSKQYRALIEFVSPKEYLAELRVLVDDLKDDPKAGTASGRLAFDTLKPVFPGINKNEIIQIGADALIRTPSVVAVLGTANVVEEGNQRQFSASIQRFTATNASKLKSKKGKTEREPALWPLIKRIQVWVKAPVLKPGITLVDLPGTGDSNTARGSISAKYLQRASKIWVVSAIGRAVNDEQRTAFLDKHFQRQLRLDGKYSQITFICTKTDDLISTEAVEEFNLKKKMKRIEKLIRKQEIACDSKGEEIKSIEEDLKAIEKKRLALWRKMRTIPRATGQKDGKRKLGSDPRGTQKRQKTKTIDNKIKQDPDGNSGIQGGIRIKTEPMENTKNQSVAVDIKREPKDPSDGLNAAEMKAEMQSIMEEKQSVLSKIRMLNVEIARGQTEIPRLQESKNTMCIQARNEASRNKIKSSFLEEIREYDNNDDYDEDNTYVRDIEELEGQIKVFCVSSRVYQKLRGRYRTDNAGFGNGFRDLYDTEIPQLRNHVVESTMDARITHSQSFLNDTEKVLGSVFLWCHYSLLSQDLSDQERIDEIDHLNSALGTLQTSLESRVDDLIAQCQKTLHLRIFKHCDRAVSAATAQAMETVKSWNDQFYWNTYKAVCRRSGQATQRLKCGARDLNQELLEGLWKNIMRGWDSSFGAVIPSAIKRKIRECKAALEIFKAYMQTREAIEQPAVLKNQVNLSATEIDNAGKEFRALINQYKMEASREFMPHIQESMESAYCECAKVAGRGTLQKIREIMIDKVDRYGQSMFEEAFLDVQKGLEDNISQFREHILETMQDIVRSLKRDYLTNIGGEEPDDVTQEARDKCIEILLRANDDFLAALTTDAREYLEPKLVMEIPSDESNDIINTPGDDGESSSDSDSSCSDDSK